MTKTTPPTAPTDGNGKRKKILKIVGAVAAVIAVFFIVRSFLYESTDDAYVQAHALMLAPRIGGTVTQVLVNENQAVTLNQLLAQLDDHDYSQAMTQALGDQDSVKADLSTLQWSGFSGNYSSGLKNWALCGICIAVFCWGTGPHAITLSDRIIPGILGLPQ